MILETSRLKLIPLSLYDLEGSIVDKEKVEKENGLTSDENTLDDEMKAVYMKKINKIRNNTENYLYYTYWQIVDKTNNRIMGTVGYKGIPDIKGEIEVGYGLSPNYRGFGYMTEALDEFMNWAFTDKDQKVKAVIARTLKDNIPSQKVLNRLDMSIYNEDDAYIWFRKDNIIMT